MIGEAGSLLIGAEILLPMLMGGLSTRLRFLRNFSRVVCSTAQEARGKVGRPHGVEGFQIPDDVEGKVSSFTMGEFVPVRNRHEEGSSTPGCTISGIGMMMLKYTNVYTDPMNFNYWRMDGSI